jgi:histidine ammonia-lyase
VSNPVQISGDELTLDQIAAVARDRRPVEVTRKARERMRAARGVVERAAAAGAPVYGLTTGLGSRVVESVDADGREFSLRTIRGRATAVGEPLHSELTRAAMVVRLNGLCAGGAGASPGLAVALADLINHHVHPRIPRTGSVGAADLCLLAHVGLTLVGEGQAELEGRWLPAAEALSRTGLEPLTLEAKDGLAICSSSAVSCGTASLALLDAEELLDAVQVAAALSMEALRANLSPLDPRVVAARSAPGQAWSASQLRALLATGDLTRPGQARRLQDPLSFRCVSQIHGSLRTALDRLDEALMPELSGAADNPVVLIEEEEILSTGNFHVPALALALDAVALGVAQVASPVLGRQARLRSPHISSLPTSLVAADPTLSGVAPLGKTAQSLLLEIRHLAAPLSALAGVGEDSVEDDATGSAQAALRLAEQLGRLRRLIAIELLMAAQALELVGPVRLGTGTQAAYEAVRELVEPLEEDRALGVDVERLASEGLASGAVLNRVRTAVGRLRHGDPTAEIYKMY